MQLAEGLKQRPKSGLGPAGAEGSWPLGKEMDRSLYHSQE